MLLLCLFFFSFHFRLLCLFASFSSGPSHLFYGTIHCSKSMCISLCTVQCFNDNFCWCCCFEHLYLCDCFSFFLFSFSDVIMDVELAIKSQRHCDTSKRKPIARLIGCFLPYSHFISLPQCSMVDVDYVFGQMDFIHGANSKLCLHFRSILNCVKSKCLRFKNKLTNINAAK